MESLTKVATEFNTYGNQLVEVDAGLAGKITSVVNVLNNTVEALKGTTTLKDKVNEFIRVFGADVGKVEGNVSEVINTAMGYIKTVAETISTGASGLDTGTLGGIAEQITNVIDTTETAVRSLEGIKKLQTAVNNLTGGTEGGSLWDAMGGGGTDVGETVKSACDYIRAVANAIIANSVGLPNPTVSFEVGGIVSSCNNLSNAVTSVSSAYASIPSVGPAPNMTKWNNAYNYIKKVGETISKAVVPTVTGKDFSGAASTIVDSCHSLTDALNDVAAAYAAIPDVEASPATDKISNGISYLAAMTGAFSRYKPPSDKDKTPGHDSFPIFPNGLLKGANPDDDLVNEITASVKNKINVKKSLDVNVVVNHISEDSSIDTYQVVSNLREYKGGIFTDRQLSKLAKDIGRFA
jgi:hypothetical protein